MDKLNQKALNDNRIMTVLRVKHISHDICQTSMGVLRLRLNKDETGKDYRFVLDSVPVSDENNKDLLELFADII